jgi:hypothetical protein
MMSNKKEKNMARPQTVNQLPDDVKQELNKKLTENSSVAMSSSLSGLILWVMQYRNHLSIAMLSVVGYLLLLTVTPWYYRRNS